MKKPKRSSSSHDFFSSRLPWRNGKGKKGIAWRLRSRRRPGAINQPRLFQWGSISTSYSEEESS